MSPSPRSSVGGFLALARLSNAPTCISNVLVGWAIGGGENWLVALAFSAAVVLLYAGGMALNDLVDQRIDTEAKRDRPLVTGAVTVDAAQRFAWFTMTAGLGIIAVHGLAAFGTGLALVVCIIVYDVLHKKHAASVLIMGACRGLVYVTAAAALTWPVPWLPTAWFAGALIAYIALITMVARIETRGQPGARRWLALLLPVCVAVPVLVNGEPGVPAIIAAVVSITFITLVASTLWKPTPNIGRAIQGWLAAICLIDGTFLMLMEQDTAALIAAVCFVATLLGHRRIAGT